MTELLQSLQIVINSQLYVKDPQSSDLGKRILSEGIRLIGEVGFERFTFKKLGDKIGSNESSIYRYFENKHKFLIYLNSWYWVWLEYRLVLSTNSVSDSREKVNAAIEVLTLPVEADAAFAHIDEVALNKIVINEHLKPFLTPEVGVENRQGYFEVYKRLVGRFAQMIRECCPDYPNALSLASTVISGSLHQYFLNAHLPSLTDFKNPRSNTEFFKNLVISSLNL
ncbi:TetR/AcrR family transcriptional regulator [Robiginitalea sp.]|nr:TetR/AcrR family transcriptional regulator [Robiginitalea sp.]